MRGTKTLLCAGLALFIAALAGVAGAVHAAPAPVNPSQQAQSAPSSGIVHVAWDRVGAEA